MKVGFHPVVDNPVRMGYVPGWTSIDMLAERLGDLEHAVGEGRIVPARWEPYYQECPSCRHAGAYRWALSQLQNPAGFAQALALFPGEEDQLGTPIGVISIARPEAANAALAVGQLPEAESAVMYRGRAADKLAARAARRSWTQFTECPHEDLREPGRVHVDPFGNLHICQGISLGNLFQSSLADICRAYDPDSHPISGPLLAGGPSELARRYDAPHAESYADACHLCYEARRALRGRYAEVLMPDQMYCVPA